jgi:hypothetical protein
MPLNMLHVLHRLLQCILVLFHFGKYVDVSPYSEHQPHVLLESFSVDSTQVALDPVSVYLRLDLLSHD